MRDVYKQVRREKQGGKETRLVVEIPIAEIDALDNWAAAQNFPNRKAALRHIIKMSIFKTPSQEAA